MKTETYGRARIEDLLRTLELEGVLGKNLTGRTEGFDGNEGDGNGEKPLKKEEKDESFKVAVPAMVVWKWKWLEFRKQPVRRGKIREDSRIGLARTNS